MEAVDRLGVVERGYQAVAAGDRDALQEAFAEDAVWRLMNRTEVVRTFEGRDAVVDFLLRFKELRLEAIMAVGDAVVAAHSFAPPGGGRAIATTMYEFRGLQVIASPCSDVMRR